LTVIHSALNALVRPGNSDRIQFPPLNGINDDRWAGCRR